MAKEAAVQTLQATALVHEAWLRLTDGQAHNWLREVETAWEPGKALGVPYA
jgi:hypothetical protein